MKYSLTCIVWLWPLAQVQSRAIVDPLTRFNGKDLSFPEVNHTLLQLDFADGPDCGEATYVGRGRLEGRRALITGGDSGMGRAIAIAFAREGARVAINYLPEEELDAGQVADVINKEFPDRPLVQLPGDLLKETFCTELVHDAARELGGLDIVVNNAGFGGFQAGPNYRNISAQSTSQLDRIFRTNLYAPFFISRAAVPILPPGSSILFTVSTVASSPLSNALDYSASKAALANYVGGLAQHVAPLGIRVNGVSPGLTYTSFLPNAGYSIEDITSWVMATPAKRMAQPSEIAPLFVALADDSQSFTTGSILGVHGAAASTF